MASYCLIFKLLFPIRKYREWLVGGGRELSTQK